MSLFTVVDIDQWRAEYHPCENGVHIFQPEGGEHGGLTLENFPGLDLTLFREHSSAGEGDNFDLLADLFIDGDLIDNVAIRRQDLEVIRRALKDSQHD